MHRTLMVNLGLAGLLLSAPALRAQDRVVAPMTLAPVRTSIPLRSTLIDSASFRGVTIPRAGLDDDENHSRLGRIVTWTLLGGLAGGAIAYYTAPNGSAGCLNCEDDREPRMIKGALIGGTIGLTLGVLVTLGGGTRLAIR